MYEESLHAACSVKVGGCATSETSIIFRQASRHVPEGSSKGPTDFPKICDSTENLGASWMTLCKTHKCYVPGYEVYSPGICLLLVFCSDNQIAYVCLLL